MLKLDEAFKFKESIFKMLNKHTAKILSNCMQNLFLSMNFVYKSLFKKFSKVKLKELDTSSKVALHLTEFLGQYMDIIEEAFSADQK